MPYIVGNSEGYFAGQKDGKSTFTKYKQFAFELKQYDTAVKVANILQQMRRHRVNIYEKTTKPYTYQPLYILANRTARKEDYGQDDT